MSKKHQLATIRKRWESHEQHLKKVMSPAVLNVARQCYIAAWLDAFTFLTEELNAMSEDTGAGVLDQFINEAKELARSEVGKMKN